MSLVIPLPIFPYPLTPERYALIGQALSTIALPYQLQPAPGVPGSPGRILCFGRPAPFYGESVVVRPENVDNVDSIRRALEFLLKAPAGTPGSFTEEMFMEAIFGPGTRVIAELDEFDLREEEEAARYAAP